jgi:uncharacterized protein YpmS
MKETYNKWKFAFFTVIAVLSLLFLFQSYITLSHLHFTYKSIIYSDHSDQERTFIILEKFLNLMKKKNVQFSKEFQLLRFLGQIVVFQ